MLLEDEEKKKLLLEDKEKINTFYSIINQPINRQDTSKLQRYKLGKISATGRVLQQPPKDLVNSVNI